MKSQLELAVQIALDAWNAQIKGVNKLIDSLSDEQLQQPVAPGRNSGVYLLGHLTVLLDNMLPLYAFGEKLHPELESFFVRTPDKATQNKPSPATLRQNWSEVNAALSSHMNEMSTDDWFQKHASISAEDFVKEPNRNKLNVLLNRTSHVAYHLGQFMFLKPVVADQQQA